MANAFAHSVRGRPESEWETQAAHANAVSRGAASSAALFGWQSVAAAGGRLHDIGKCSAAFGAYLRAAGTQARGPDHSTAGAIEARRLYPGPIGRMLAFAIAGHHAGLADGEDLAARLRKTPPDYTGWESAIGPPEAQALVMPRLRRMNPYRGFSEQFIIRMLFSCLVDADRIETERFYAACEKRPVEREGFTPLPVLHERLIAFRATQRTGAPDTPVNALRAEVLDHAMTKAALPPGLFTLTVPTGGGKTLTSLSFALEHAVRHGLRRVVYVIPFTSIVEQTADVFRHALADPPGGENGQDILEHHAAFDWDTASGAGEEGRGSDVADRLRRAAENWAAPVVVTTAVQFFESLFASRTGRCRKLHNLARSVIVLDEAQTLPRHLLRPCLAALDEIALNYGTSVVLCTATQPALRKQDGFLKQDERTKVESGLDIPDVREIAPDPRTLYARLKRVTVERLDGPVADATIAARFAVQDRMPCVVNTRAHAQALFARLKGEALPGALHLSTLMCPAHRRQVLALARARLAAGHPVRLVSTSLIEAGVDIDFPEVWRAAAGIDSIAQAAGRCNREGAPTLGRVVVFEPAESRPPHDLQQAWQAGRAVLRRTDDPLGLDAVRDYFQTLYWHLGAEALDAGTLDGKVFPILTAIGKRAPQRGELDPDLAFPFASIARAFRLIDEVMEPVIVPWRATPDDRTCETILGRIATMDQPLGADLPRLQQYVVGLPRTARAEWLALGVLRPLHPALGEALLQFDGLSHYDEDTGVRLSDTLERAAKDNLM